MFFFFWKHPHILIKRKTKVQVTIQNTKRNTTNINKTKNEIRSRPLCQQMALLIKAPRHPVNRRSYLPFKYIGIYRMSGIRKTTLSRVVFQKFHHLFLAKSFLENVGMDSRKRGMVALQENFLFDLKLKINDK